MTPDFGSSSSRELPLSTRSQALAFIGQIERCHRCPIRIVDVFENLYVHSNQLVGIDLIQWRPRWWGSVPLDAETGKPIASRFFFQRDFLDLDVVGTLSVESNRNVTDPQEGEEATTDRPPWCRVRSPIGCT